jgi:signal transduction histidine kinase
VPTLIAEALSSLPLEQEGVSTVLELDPTLPAAQLDVPQVQRLIANLATNAVQAMAESPRKVFTLRARRQLDDLVLVVEDTGHGISEEVRHRLFEPLATTRAKGLGLGLALCRRIAEKHGGEIRAHNRPGGGARFEVRLANAFHA